MTPLRRTSHGALLALCLVTACATPKPTAEPAPQAPPKAERAVLAAADGLWIVPLDGAPPTKLSSDVADLCAVDPRAGLVWWVAFDPKTETSTLKAQAISDPAPHLVAQDLPPLDALLLDFGPDKGALGHREGVTFQVGAHLDLSTPTPKLKPWLGCEGDGAWYCYEEMTEGPQDTWPLKPDLLQRTQSILQAKLGAPELLSRVASLPGPLWPPAPKAAPLPPVPVPTDLCEAPEDCGVAEPILGTKLLAVTTATSRGDFFHATRQAYDPATRQFFDWRDPQDPEARSTAPLEEAPLGAYFVPPSGAGILSQGQVVSWERGPIYAAEGALACGWLEGGWTHSGFPFD